MPRTRRLLITSICALVLACALAGCSQDPKDNFTGTWNLTGMDDPDMGYFTAEQLAGFGLTDVKLTLSNDGSGTFGMFATDQDISWDMISAIEISITMPESEPAPFTLEDGELTGVLYEMTLTFERET